MVSNRLRLIVKIFLLDLFDLFSFLIFVTGVVLFIRFFVFNPYSVVGASMEPSFSQGDFIIVDKITPKIGDFKRGDIIVFVPKGKNVPYIKRIIGLPGETVMVKNNTISICSSTTSGCTILPEAYIPKDFQTLAKCGKDTFTMDGQGYFAMGDHRGHSTDSLCCFSALCSASSNYQIYPEDIIGKVMLRVFPNFTTHW